MKPDISILIPFLNEAEALPSLVEQLGTYCGGLQPNIEILFIDDGSSDGSLDVLKSLSHQNYQAQFVKLSKNFGSHNALRAGLLKATGEYIVFLYADLQDPLELIEKLYEECKKGKDVVWASREKQTMGFMSRFFSQSYARLMRCFAVSQYPDNGFDVVMFSHKVQEQLNNNIENHSSIFLQILTIGYRNSTITYQKRPRQQGISKWTLRKKVKLLTDSFITYSYAPIGFVVAVGTTFFVIGILWTAYILFRTLVYGDLNPGWPTLISVLFIGFGTTNISLAVLAEYLWRTLDASRNRPAFIIEDYGKLESSGKS